MKWKKDNEFHWKFPSPTFKQLVKDTYQFQYNPIRPISDSDRVKLKIAGKVCGYESSITNLSSWVFNIKPGSKSDLILVEHSMSLGRYGGISLLYPAA